MANKKMEFQKYLNEFEKLEEKNKQKIIYQQLKNLDSVIKELNEDFGIPNETLVENTFDPEFYMALIKSINELQNSIITLNNGLAVIISKQKYK